MYDLYEIPEMKYEQKLLRFESRATQSLGPYPVHSTAATASGDRVHSSQYVHGLGINYK